MAQKKPVSQSRQSAVGSRQSSARTIHESSLRLTPKLPLIFLWLIIIIVSIIRHRLVDVAFERDEGEYGYIGSLFLHGVAPFKDAYTMKLPGTPFMYAVLMLIFGRTSAGVHTGLIFINAATMYFLFAAFKKILTPFIGLSTACIYGFMALGLSFYGFAAHATHFICFYSSIALWFLAGYMKDGKAMKIFLCGLMLGMAFLMKQQAAFLIIFGAVFLFIYLKIIKLSNYQIIKLLLLFSSGVFIPYFILVLIVVFTGQFKIFWLWTIDYASKYEAVKQSWDVVSFQFNSSFTPAWTDYYYFWLLALGGLLVLYWSPYTRLQKLFVVGYIIASVCVLSSGFYFRQHYFIVILPAVGLLSGIFLEFITKQILKLIKNSTFNIQHLTFNISLVFLTLIIAFNIYFFQSYYFNNKKPYWFTPRYVCNGAYWGNPFNEAQDIAKYIKDNTNDTDNIAVLGSEPEIYFYANRRAATGYLYTYPLVEVQPYNLIMQEEMIKEIEKNKPAFIVFCNIMYSWLPHPNTPKTIFEWGNTYTHQHYTAVGFIDFFNDTGWKFCFNNEINNHTDKAQSFIIVFKRNEPGVRDKE